MMLRHRGIVRVAAAIPAPRGEPPERLVNARDPGFLGARRRGAPGRARTARGSFGRVRSPSASTRAASLTSTSITARSPSSFRPVEVSALRSHDSTSASSRRSASASLSRSTACSRSKAASSHSLSMARRKAVRACIRPAPDAAGTLPARSSCRAPGRASSRRRCPRRRRREWSHAASAPAGRAARSPAR